MDEAEAIVGEHLDFDVICRFCMKFSLFLKPIFCEDDDNESGDCASTHGDSETVAEIINLCTQLKISLDDKLPKFLCNACMDELLRWNKFRKQCLNSDEKLRAIIENPKIPKKSPEDNDDIKSLDDIYDVAKIYDLKDNELNEIHARSSKLFIFNPTQPDLMTSRNNDSDETGEEHNEGNVDYSQEGCNDENSSFRKYLCRKTSNDVIVSVKALHRQKCRECKKVCSSAKCLKNHLTAHEKQRQSLDNTSEDETKESQGNPTIFSQTNGYNSGDACHNHRGSILDVNKKESLYLGIRVYRCDQCNKYFKSRQILLKHRKVHVREKDVFKCWKCRAMFLLPTSYRRHMEVHNSTTEKSDENI